MTQKRENISNDMTKLLKKVQYKANLLQELQEDMVKESKNMVNTMTREDYETLMKDIISARDDLVAVKENIPILTTFLTTSISILDTQKRKINHLFGHSKQNSLQWMAAQKVKRGLPEYPQVEEALMHLENRELPTPPASSKKSKGGRKTRKRGIRFIF